MNRNIGTRALAIILAEAHHAAADRIYFLIDQLDRGALDPDALEFSAEDPVALAEQALDLVKVKPINPEKKPSEKKKPGKVRRVQVDSARVCQMCGAKDLRFSTINGKPRQKCFACGNVPLQRDAPCDCGGVFKFRRSVIEGEKIVYRECDKCGTSNLNGILRVRSAVKRVEAKRAAKVEEGDDE